jgi:hypothetical protein
MIRRKHMFAAAAPDADSTVCALYQAHYQSLVRLGALVVGDCGTAEEVVQDTFVGNARRTSSLPIPCPSNSRAIVTSDRLPPSKGSIVPLAIAMTGMPPTPRTSQVLGGFSSVISSVVRNPRDRPAGSRRLSSRRRAGHHLPGAGGSA